MVDWLLGTDQPAVRYRTLKELLHRPEGDEEVRQARAALPTRGWAKEVLDLQRPSGCWHDERSLFTPSFHATFWMLLLLADLRMTKEDPRVDRAARLWIERNRTSTGGFGQTAKGPGHLCITGNTARALVRLGYGEDQRVRKAFDWLVRNQAELGGWSCWNFGDPPHKGRTLDAWEPLSAFAAYPRSRWSRSMTAACERGAEFFLDRELHRQGARFEPWFRFHYPYHYYYDLLVGLDTLTALGYGSDPRLRFAIDHLLSRRRRDGRWNLDANRPEDSPALAAFRRQHPRSEDLTPFVLETPGRPSKMITLTAMTVLERLREAS